MPARGRVDAELDERVAVERPARQRSHRAASSSTSSERSASTAIRSRVGLAEDVVEDLERQRPVVAGGEHVRGEVGEVEAALPGEAAVVAAPLEDVHHEVRRVGELEEEDLLAGDRADRAGSLPRERMWNESRQVPRFGCAPASTIRQACS